MTFDRGYGPYTSAKIEGEAFLGIKSPSKCQSLYYFGLTQAAGILVPVDIVSLRNGEALANDE
jgi:hypothetical protein